MSLMLAFLLISVIPMLTLISLVAVDRMTPLRHRLATVILEPVPARSSRKRRYIE